MRTQVRRGTIIIASVLAAAGGAQAQEMQMSKQEQHHQMELPPVKPEYPRMGRAQENAKSALVTLEQVQKIASESNPTLRQAEAEIRAAKARQQQSGLYPNPTVAYTGDEIRGGSVGSGKQGFFVQQTVVTGGKLGLSRGVFGKDVKLAEIEGEEQKLRVQSAVKMAFLRVLAAQELLYARRDMATIAQDARETQRRLMNTGQADETEVLEAEVEAQRMRMTARMQENTLREEWRSLAAVIGRPVEGNEEVIAFVELLPSVHALPDDIVEWCEARLAPYKRPAEIRVLAVLPAASTGKVLKHKLRDEL